MKISKERLFDIAKEVWEKNNCLPTDPKKMADWEDGVRAWALLWERDEYESEKEIYLRAEKEVFIEKYGEIEPQININEELAGDALKEDIKRQMQKITEWRDCKYNLIKNDMTAHLEKEFTNDQYWYLDCGEWGYAIISTDQNVWYSSLSNGVELALRDLDTLCEQSIGCLVNEVENNLETLEQRREKDIQELQKAKCLVKTLPLIIQNTEQDIARLKELASKKTLKTEKQIIQGLLRKKS